LPPTLLDQASYERRKICLYCRKETAMDADSRTAVSIEQEKLLKQSPQALAEFNEHLVGALTPNIGGRKWDDELRKRQAKYAKAYLQFTKPGPRLCALCLRFRN